MAVFSIFLEINTAKLLNYFIFLMMYYALVGLYMYSKHSVVYTIDDGELTMKSLFRPIKRLAYDDIVDLSIAQGILARRFKCGTIFVQTKNKGSVAIFGGGGGSAEALRDVKEPGSIVDEISSRLAPFSQIRAATK